MGGHRAYVTPKWGSVHATSREAGREGVTPQSTCAHARHHKEASPELGERQSVPAR